MKAKNAVMLSIPIILCVIFIIVPILRLIGLICDLDFVFYNEAAIVITQAVLAIGAAVALFVVKPKYSNTGRIFLILSAPISLLNALCFADAEWKLSIIFAVVWSGCIFASYLKFTPDSSFKAIAAVVSVLLAITLVVCFIVGIVYNAFVHSFAVYESIDSMHGTYRADLGTSENVLGTKTEIYINKNEPEFKVILGCFYVKPIQVFEGEDYEIKTVTIDWLDDSTVIINGDPYKVTEE